MRRRSPRLRCLSPEGCAGVSVKLVLASASAERKRLLEALGIRFEVRPADIDEAVVSGEDADRYAARMAEAKCRAVAQETGSGVVLAADTCAVASGRMLGKPAGRDDAVRMLLSVSGRKVAVRTAVAMMGSVSGDDEAFDTAIVYGEMEMCTLDRKSVERYLALEPVAEKVEAAFVADGMGPAICRNIREEEPGTVSGLPMITVCHMLRNAGVDLP